jgi:predicted Zn finger-like uncharacterized protein
MASALATRCPACSTVFRVVPDQLRVSEGWVRCGRCTEVFKATESLVDLETGARRDWADVLARSPTPGLPNAGPPPADAQAEAGAPAADARTADVDLSTIGAGSAPPAAPEQAPPPQPVSLPLPQQGGAAAGLQAEAAAEPQAGTPEAPADRPSFVRRAERAERWRQPRVRAALAAAALLGVLGIAAQIVYEYRDLAAARFPQLRPALEQACALLGCRVEAARAIDALAVESSGLVRVEKSSLYKLSVALRNRAGIEVALPALELAVTDTGGRLIARKVLLATDLGASQPALGAGRELVLQATLQAALPDTEPVAGYTIELFYP